MCQKILMAEPNCNLEGDWNSAKNNFFFYKKLIRLTMNNERGACCFWTLVELQLVESQSCMDKTKKEFNLLFWTIGWIGKDSNILKELWIWMYIQIYDNDYKWDNRIYFTIFFMQFLNSWSRVPNSISCILYL